MENDTKAEFRSGFIAVIGRPNVGKSTLINCYLGQKIAAVSHVAQTTRRKQLGILTLDHAQLVFMDTPGIHEAAHKLGGLMNDVALETLSDADVILWLVDVSEPPEEGDRLCAEALEKVVELPPVLLVMNKSDLVDTASHSRRAEIYQNLFPYAEPVFISATAADGTKKLLEKAISMLPIGPQYYETDQITDLYERDIAADLIREAALVHLKDEVPHSVAVRIDQFDERGDTGAHIDATIFVERDSQKGIVIGRGASMLKKIGETARKEIEKMSGRRVYLEIRVKVSKNWRQNPAILKQMGFTRR
jgi:GTPase